MRAGQGSRVHIVSASIARSSSSRSGPPRRPHPRIDPATRLSRTASRRACSPRRTTRPSVPRTSSPGPTARRGASRTVPPCGSTFGRHSCASTSTTTGGSPNTAAATIALAGGTSTHVALGDRHACATVRSAGACARRTSNGSTRVNKSCVDFLTRFASLDLERDRERHRRSDDCASGRDVEAGRVGRQACVCGRFARPAPALGGRAMGRHASTNRVSIF